MSNLGQPSIFEKDIRKVCAKLKAIGNIQFGEKWNSTNQQAEATTILDSAKRTLYHWSESRDNSVNDFKTTYDEANIWCGEILERYDHATARERDTLVLLLCDLTDQMHHSKMGLVRQKGQYNKDENAKGELDDVIVFVNNCLKTTKIRIMERQITRAPIDDPEFRGHLHAIVPTGKPTGATTYDPLSTVKILPEVDLPHIHNTIPTPPPQPQYAQPQYAQPQPQYAQQQPQYQNSVDSEEDVNNQFHSPVESAPINVELDPDLFGMEDSDD